jgi:hypothetical protein
LGPCLLPSTVDPGPTVALLAVGDVGAQPALRQDRQFAFRAVAGVGRELHRLEVRVGPVLTDQIPEQQHVGRPIAQALRHDDLAVGMRDGEITSSRRPTSAG